MKLPVQRTMFATRQALLIGSVRELLLAAGIAADPSVVDPEELERSLDPTEECLVILDGQSLPPREMLIRLCHFQAGSCFVLWTVRPTAELLQTAIECGFHGLLSTRLPLQEASQVLLRICRGERLFRFDSNPGPLDLPEPLHLSARERQILYVLREGATNAGIAEALDTSEGTIKLCLSRMFRKTGARNRQELVTLAQCGILIADEPRPRVADRTAFDAQWMLHGGEPERGQI